MKVSESEDQLDPNSYERVSIYPEKTEVEGPLSDFLLESGNMAFRRSVMTWISLGFLILFYPGISLAFVEDPANLADLLTETILLVTLIATIMFQWVMFLMLYVATFLEKTGLRGIGLKKIRGVDFAWAISFLLVANIILTGLAWVLAQVGLPMPGELSLLIPQDPLGRVVWVLVSLTAGFCEETAFRGYLMTRIRILGKTKSWLIPTAVSALAFGICHAYQGIPGLIVITVYGVMFSLLYIRTGSLWPGIIAHSLQDVMALFFPH